MAFGPIMHVSMPEMNIELAPIAREDLGEFISPGMQNGRVTRYLTYRRGPVLQDEQEWYDKVRAQDDAMTWGIWVVQSEGTRLLIGTTSLHDITTGRFAQATSGSMIFRTDYWGKGIASAIHMARTWYGFEQLGLSRIKSAVIHGNAASLKALMKSGYVVHHVERNTTFADGTWRHQDNLECLNPAAAEWKAWWAGERPPQRNRDARERTLAALAWAEKNVRL